MAASVKENDYVNKIVMYLRDNTEVNSAACNFANWEMLYTDRAETVSLIEPYLNEYIDLITIQLGENTRELSTFESDFEYLITYVRQKSPNAEIIIIGDFWEYNGRDLMKKRAAEKCGAVYIDLSEIKDNAAYQCGMGTTVYDASGKSYAVEHNGVAEHPDDVGMQYIADAVIAALKKK